jgi:FdhD protein
MQRSSRSKRRIITVENGRATRRSDLLAIEEPLEILLRVENGQQREERTVAITMRTPGHDYELAAGFLYNEGIVQKKFDILSMLYCVEDADAPQEYNALRVHLNRTVLPDLAPLDRHFFTTSACGVCGRTMLDDLAQRTLPPLTEDAPEVAAPMLTLLPTTLRKHQNIFATTGGLHAAALFDTTGKLLALREDVGRHNALDKLIGWGLLNRQLPFHDKIILVSGRASYELLHKARVAGAPIVCAVSAPSSLAVDLAHRFGITLVGFLRGSRFNIYTHPQRIALDKSPSTHTPTAEAMPAPDNNGFPTTDSH